MIRLIKRELLLFYRSRIECLHSLLFFIIIVSLFGFILPNHDLPKFAPCIFWIGALLAALLSLNQLFKDDFSDGSLAQMLLAPTPLPMIILAKVIAHWLVFSLPLIVIAPIVAKMFQLNESAIAILLLTLLLGTPVLHFIGAFAAALSVGLRQSNVLLALVLMPLFVPTLIFAVSANTPSSRLLVPLLCLSALLIIALTLLPFITSIALTISVNYDKGF